MTMEPRPFRLSDAHAEGPASREVRKLAFLLRHVVCNMKHVDRRFFKDSIHYSPGMDARENGRQAVFHQLLPLLVSYSGHVKCNLAQLPARGDPSGQVYCDP